MVALALCGCAKAPAWEVPEGWREERIPFPLDFAPELSHQGVERIRFSPGFFDPKSPGWWSYAFVWRLDDPADLDGPALASELQAYFGGLARAVDPSLAIPTTAEAVPADAGFALTVHTADAFTTKGPVELVGTAARTACDRGSLWVFSLSPPGSPRTGLADLVAGAACDQRR